MQPTALLIESHKELHKSHRTSYRTPSTLPIHILTDKTSVRFTIAPKPFVSSNFYNISAVLEALVCQWIEQHASRIEQWPLDLAIFSGECISLRPMPLKDFFMFAQTLLHLEVLFLKDSV